MCEFATLVVAFGSAFGIVQSAYLLGGRARAMLVVSLWGWGPPVTHRMDGYCSGSAYTLSSSLHDQQSRGYILYYIMWRWGPGSPFLYDSRDPGSLKFYEYGDPVIKIGVMVMALLKLRIS